MYYKRLRTNPCIRFITMAEVEKISGSAGDFTVSVKMAPRFVNGKCTACNDCVEACPEERLNDFNYGMDTTKAIYLPHDLAVPFRYVIDVNACKGRECAKCVSACKYDAIDLDMKPETRTLHADVVVVATGWKPYDAKRIDNLRFGQLRNVITNVMMERMAASNGPSQKQILRPSDGKKVERIAFIQCAGSRDENHLPFCSSVCCMASLKQATYVREFNPEARIFVFYIDLRTRGRYEDFLNMLEQDEKLDLLKGKVGKIEEIPDTGDLVVVAEDMFSGKKHRETVDMVVLATGMNPSMANENIPFDAETDQYGFFVDDPAKDKGIYFVGCCKTPSDVSSCIKDANGAALKAIQCIGRK